MKSKGVMLGLALLALALTVSLSASREVAASPSIELRQTFLGGYGLPVYNNAFKIQIAGYGFGYGFAPGTAKLATHIDHVTLGTLFALRVPSIEYGPSAWV